MDNETYDQSTLNASTVDENTQRFLTDGLNVQVSFYEGAPITLGLPTTVDLLITHSDPGLKGDRSSAGTKPATLETGAIVQVPLFVEQGERVRVDTRTGEYVTRVQS
jgi:elongation factor P